MKIVTFADFHIGHQQYSRINPETGLYYRVENALDVLDELLDYTRKKGIKVVVLAGDAYKSVAVSETIKNEFNKRIALYFENGYKSEKLNYIE